MNILAARDTARPGFQAGALWVVRGLYKGEYSTHDEPRPPHSCFAKQNLRRKIFTGVGLTKERSVMKYLNHFTSLACWISGWTPTTISRYTWCGLNRKSIDSSLCGPNTWGSPWAKLRRCGDLFSCPGRHKIVCGGKIEQTFKAFDRRCVADLPEWSGIEECCCSSADGRLLFSPTRIVRAHCDVSLHEWVNLPHLSDVRVHAALETYVCMYESISNPFEYPAPARFPRALLGRCLWISGVLLLPSFLVDLCDWWPTALNAMLGQLWKYSCGLHYTSPANSNDLKDRRNSYHINEIIGRQIDFRV